MVGFVFIPYRCQDDIRGGADGGRDRVLIIAAITALVGVPDAL